MFIFLLSATFMARVDIERTAIVVWEYGAKGIATAKAASHSRFSACVSTRKLYSLTAYLVELFLRLLFWFGGSIDLKNVRLQCVH
jgi:hypothetical protein